MTVLLFFTAAAISFDAFFIGMAYTMRGIHITKRAKVAVFLVTYFGMLGVIAAGNLAAQVIPARVFTILGGCMLVGIGINFLRRAFLKHTAEDYDFDHSKEIDWKEGLTLALAVAFDAIGAAFAFMGQREAMIPLPFFAAILHVLFLSVGIVICNWQKKRKKKQLGEVKMKHISELLAGSLLCVIGMMRFFL